MLFSKEEFTIRTPKPDINIVKHAWIPPRQKWGSRLEDENKPEKPKRKYHQ